MYTHKVLLKLKKSAKFVNSVTSIREEKHQLTIFPVLFCAMVFEARPRTSSSIPE